MRTTHETVVRSTPAAIFALAADVERWPALHPAYRWCRVLDRTPNTVLFEMGGRIRGWPARWRARQERFPEQGRIVFRHLGGLTRGMLVEWRLRPAAAGSTHLRIDHEFIMSWPVVGRFVSDVIIGPVFIDWIARATLRGIKQLLE